MSDRWMPATDNVPPRSRAANATGTSSPAGANRIAASNGSGATAGPLAPLDPRGAAGPLAPLDPRGAAGPLAPLDPRGAAGASAAETAPSDRASRCAAADRVE